MMDFLKKLFPEFQQYSIDECFLNMTNFLMKSTLEEKAKEIKEKILNLRTSINAVIYDKDIYKDSEEFKSMLEYVKEHNLRKVRLYSLTIPSTLVIM